jgi:hypothetical protein
VLQRDGISSGENSNMLTRLRQLLHAPRRRRAASSSPRSFWPCLDALEDRLVPAFLAPTSYPTGAAAWDVQTADVNNDGKLDLLTVNRSAGTISVALGKGDGTFAAPHSFAAGSNPREMAVGDFNRDGKLDVITVNQSGTLNLLRGNGDGTFQAPTSIKLGAGTSGVIPVSIAVGDMNGDGKLDLVVGAEGGIYKTKGYTYQDALIYVLTGNGNGTFSSASSLDIKGDVVPTWEMTTPGVSPVNLALGDVNGDGKLDVVAATYQRIANATGGGNRPIYLLPGDGTGHISQGPMIDVAGLTAGLYLADFNGDGRLDLAVGTGNGSGGWMQISLGNGNGTFQATQFFNTGAGNYAAAVAPVDINHDGKLDLVIANGNQGGISVLLGNGDGTFQTPQTFGSANGYAGLAVGDFNGDGYPDLAAINGTTISVFLNDKIW